MTELLPSISVDKLRVGLYIHLDLNWIQHPFLLSHFKIESERQIEAIRDLGLKEVRWSPELSDPEPTSGATKRLSAGPVAAASTHLPARVLTDDELSLLRCERKFAEAAQSLREIFKIVLTQPQQAREQAEQLTYKLLGELADHSEFYIRLLPEQAGDHSALHGINVATITLLLSQRLGLDQDARKRLTLAALAHDIGKVKLPERLRWYSSDFNGSECKLFQQHVEYGVALAESMGLDAQICTLIAQHHEYVDGSGFPRGLKSEEISRDARILSLVNQYDKLCNPNNPVEAVTPHQALALMFAQSRSKFDPQILSVFIRMLGVYPPGSVVLLSNGRHALVVSVNAARPLKPRVLIHKPWIPREAAQVTDLEERPDLSIRQSLKPTQLPRAAFQYLLPRQRICYFFERACAIDDRSS
ncbi:DUF3391 domain-containing protein [Caldichromatium japonicum]|uniref:DUF3391 domain-containing protein n=1 Tax=Caldichromatium japonicum TaxID=2699430 RepID=A0A6G7VCG1_9GAMM|nr:HD-GYP domain-containing protein [Caldichromatium japonicum]QIK37565.1 DUF3391 domain-containing protein [Caldichromatium japonicum]